MSDYLDPNNEELLKDFYLEAEMQVDTFEQNLLVLENNPDNSDAVDEIFRAAHTLKGGAGTVQMGELAEFTHVCEDALDEIRNGKVSVTGELVDLLLNAIDVIKAMLEERKEGGVYQEDTSALKSALKSYIEGGAAPKAGSPDTGASDTPSAPAADDAGEPEISEYEMLEMKEAAGPDKSLLRIDVHLNPDNPMNTVGGIQVFAALKNIGEVLKTEPDFDTLYGDNFFPVVTYFVATDEDHDSIEPRITIPDVVTEIIVTDLEGSGKKKSPGKDAGKGAASKPEESREAAAPKAAPPAESSGSDSGSAAGESEPSAEGEGSEAKAGKEAAKNAENEIRKQRQTGSILRVDSRRIDNLLNLVSEAVITKAAFNQISNHFGEVLGDLQNTQSQYRDSIREMFEKLPEYFESIQNGRSVKAVKKEISDSFGELFTLFDPFENRLKGTIGNFRNTSQSLARTTSELQEGVMQIRMVPISQIFSRFPRLVRDVSRSLDKKINLVIEGEETELDKSVIDDLLDPLIHCVRNSIDHGIEKPSERMKAGKGEEGTVLLKASNEGNMIVIEIEDDGKGINVEAIHKKAVDRGVIHPSKQLSDVEAFNLIFDPGFSTAKEVTNISGRGVGLDVVKKQIEKLNGNVTVWSEEGKGTKFTIKLPLTLAIIQGLLVKVGTEVYAIPITSVMDSHRIRPSEIRMIDNYEVFNVRDDVVSLIRLNRLFGIPSEEEREYHFVVIVGSGDKKMGLIVDALIGEEDVVIKPLRDRYTNSPGIAGATILGDGTVSLIIDVSQLLDLGLKQEKEQRRKRETTIM